MPVTGITTDVDTRTLTITAEFAAPVTRVWAMYADPRQLEHQQQRIALCPRKGEVRVAGQPLDGIAVE